MVRSAVVFCEIGESEGSHCYYYYYYYFIITYPLCINNHFLNRRIHRNSLVRTCIQIHLGINVKSLLYYCLQSLTDRFLRCIREINHYLSSVVQFSVKSDGVIVVAVSNHEIKGRIQRFDFVVVCIHKVSVDVRGKKNQKLYYIWRRKSNVEKN